MNLFALNEEEKKILFKKGDQFLLDNMYVQAFKVYKNLLEESPKMPALHYRLALIYNTLYPEKYSRDRELFFALKLVCNKNIFIEHINPDFLKQTFIISPEIEKKVAQITTRTLSLHHHCKVIIVPTSHYTFSIFLISRELEKIKLSFITSLFCDHIDQIQFDERYFPSTQSNLLIIKSSCQNYHSFKITHISIEKNVNILLNKQGMYQGKYFFMNPQTMKEVIFEEKIYPSNLKNIQFKDLYFTQVTVFQYKKEQHNYFLKHQFIKDTPSSCIYSFFKALLIDKNIKKAYQMTIPEKLLRNFINPSIKDFYRQLSSPPFSDFLHQTSQSDLSYTIKKLPLKKINEITNNRKVKVLIELNEQLFQFELIKNEHWKITFMKPVKKNNIHMENQKGFMI